MSEDQEKVNGFSGSNSLTNGVIEKPKNDTSPPVTSSSTAKKANASATEIFDLGFELDDLYKHALKFYKEHELKAFTPSYEDRNRLAALTLQSKHGPVATDKEPELGALDFVGRDRRLAWHSLGSMSNSEAMKQFISMLNHLCPLFLPVIEAHAKKRDELRKQQEVQSLKDEEEEQNRQREEELKRVTFESHKKAVQEVLNRQTYSQFLAYAEQQYPSEPEKQQHLIHQLQEQHYQQYMQQMLQLNSTSPGNHEPTFTVDHTTTSPPDISSPASSTLVDTISDINRRNFQSASAAEALPLNTQSNGDVPPVIHSAKMWTRTDIEAFKDSIRKEGKEGMISVNHGEIVTIKVPTHEDGSCIFWEFCTDDYDIGFGVLFEWTDFPGSQVSVHVTESEDEEEEEDESGVRSDGETVDAEKVIGISNPAESSPDVIIPVFRRDSQDEVFVGSHNYPGKGVYHLKFDNSYSLWRSKMLYYRVYWKVN